MKSRKHVTPVVGLSIFSLTLAFAADSRASGGQPQTQSSLMCLEPYSMAFEEVRQKLPAADRAINKKGRTNAIGSIVGGVGGFVATYQLELAASPDGKGNYRDGGMHFLLSFPLGIGVGVGAGSWASNLFVSKKTKQEAKDGEAVYSRYYDLASVLTALKSAQIYSQWTPGKSAQELSHAITRLEEVGSSAGLAEKVDGKDLAATVAHSLITGDDQLVFCQDGNLMSYSEMVDWLSRQK